MSTTIHLSGGYFTWLAMLCDKPAPQLEDQLGYATGALASGWSLLLPRRPLQAANLDLRGTTRWPDGKLPNGHLIGDLIAARSDIAAASQKVEAFFQRGAGQRPAKVLPVDKPAGYPPASSVGLPQFKLHSAVEWVAVLQIGPGQLLSRAAAEAAAGRV
jgi:hypothetical protein